MRILTSPTHEAYETNLCKTDLDFFSYEIPGLKRWVTEYRPIPKNYHIVKNVPVWVTPDLILSQSNQQCEILRHAAKQFHRPQINLEHTLPPPSVSKEILEEVCRKNPVEMQVFISEYSVKQWCWNKDYRVIRHGIDTELFQPLGDKVREKVALSVVNDWKNRDIFCGYNLWTKINVPKKVVGDNPGLSRPAKDVNELISAYQHAAVFLNTSLISPVPTSLMEAMACGCVPVSTNNCMIPEIIEHGYNGFMSNDPTELESYVHFLLNNDDVREEMSQAARDTIHEHFNVQTFIKNWRELFNEVSLRY